MDAMSLMNARHSVRQYEDKPIPAEILTELKQEIDDQLVVTKRDDGSHVRWQLT